MWITVKPIAGIPGTGFFMGKEEALSWGCTRVEKEQGCLLRRPWFSIYVRPPDWPYFLHHNIYSRNIFCCSWFSRLDCSILSIWADEFSLQNPRTIIVRWLHVPVSFVIVIFPFFYFSVLAWLTVLLIPLVMLMWFQMLR